MARLKLISSTKLARSPTVFLKQVGNICGARNRGSPLPPRPKPANQSRTRAASSLRHRTCYADEEIDATDADGMTSKLLAIPEGSSLLRISQLIFSTWGKATIYVVGLYRSGRHTLLIRRFR
ncbi:MAG TPA: UTRA domain-containing protein [Candidatus Acidoferrales bacterium]|nr:UTRA domain-containing protein [Candidatus Acidoferrales bacterium]